MFFEALCLYSATEDNLDGIRNKAQLEELLMKIFMLSNETVADTWNFLYLQTTAVGRFSEFTVFNLS